MSFVFAAVLVHLLGFGQGQLAGTNTAENPPALSFQTCTKGGGCQKTASKVTLDANWRWLHAANTSSNCYTGQTWDKTLCSDPTKCATSCALDGADYPGTYGITSTGDALKMKFVTHGPYSTNIGSRVYMMAGDDKYKMFKLKNQEFTFDVDVSNLPCGINGALYFAEMSEDGGLKEFPTNKAGAKYGTGYCDAQCPHDVKFIDGKANVENWKPSATDMNSGTGSVGSCCYEMDIWEANSASQAFTAHTCKGLTGPKSCTGALCGDSPANRYGGLCDKDGCDYASYRLGNHGFYGPGKRIDTTKKFTVVTQFITKDHTATGELVEIRRLYVQNGKVIGNSRSRGPELKKFDSITDAYCEAEKKLFDDKNDFTAKGGLKAMGAAMQRGMVLVMSLWDDHDANLLWLQSNYPLNKGNKPGVSRGNCDPASGVPKTVEGAHPDASVEYSNIRFGDIGSTYTAASTTASSSHE
ncbi:family 7 glycoside hydrolase [Melampsora larici-populina 98AG31]|uniref:Glucanase n=1 Tax=Melampsora larici-populina (strain 98AG31 / pathotype 3-4-7) TaxID=747676 RepID=F4S3Z3_MELLP|nr:family 7 glycoside hydrolase [Melampsora larici-populina 98AG31]EGG00616.1 family 7 glycoside hydrolase [Melampsora larici-populina 98AG31]